MEKVWKKIRSGLTDGFRSLSDKTEEMTKIGRLKLEIIAIKRDIEKVFIELGGRIYHDFKDKSVLDDPDVKRLVKDVKKKETKLKTLEEKIDQVRIQRTVSIDDDQ